MEKQQLIKIKYSEFIRSDKYSLFLWILGQEKEEIIKLMISENDKERLYILKKQHEALNNLELSIQSKIYNEE